MSNTKLGFSGATLSGLQLKTEKRGKMNIGIFSSLSRSYLQAIKNSFYFIGSTHFLLKPVALIIASSYAVILLPIACIFGLLIIFDWIGGLTDKIRNLLLTLMDKQSWNVDNSFFSFLLRPILLVLIAPLFLISLFIPKLSSNALVNLSVNEVSNIVSGVGAFKRINQIIWRTAHRLFSYVANAQLLLKPIVAIIAIPYSVILIIVGALFALLIPLDFLSRLVESIRQGIIRLANKQQEKIRYKSSAFLFAPLLLIALSPIFLAVILIPKFTSNFDTDT